MASAETAQRTRLARLHTAGSRALCLTAHIADESGITSAPACMLKKPRICAQSSDASRRRQPLQAATASLLVLVSAPQKGQRSGLMRRRPLQQLSPAAAQCHRWRLPEPVAARAACEGLERQQRWQRWRCVQRIGGRRSGMRRSRARAGRGWRRFRRGPRRRCRRAWRLFWRPRSLRC